MVIHQTYNSEMINLDTSIRSTISKKKYFEEFNKSITAKNRGILKECKDVKTIKLCCWNHSKHYINEVLEVNKEFDKESFEQVYNANCFLEYKNYKVTHEKYKDRKGFEVAEDIIHLDFMCRKCERGTSFSFESRQLQSETINLIDESFLNA